MRCSAVYFVRFPQLWLAYSHPCCFTGDLLLFSSPAVACLDRVHQCLKNFYLTIPVDVVRVKYPRVTSLTLHVYPWRLRPINFSSFWSRCIQGMLWNGRGLVRAQKQEVYNSANQKALITAVEIQPITVEHHALNVTHNQSTLLPDEDW